MRQEAAPPDPFLGGEQFPRLAVKVSCGADTRGQGWPGRNQGRTHGSSLPSAGGQVKADGIDGTEGAHEPPPFGLRGRGLRVPRWVLPLAGVEAEVEGRVEPGLLLGHLSKSDSHKVIYNPDFIVIPSI